MAKFVNTFKANCVDNKKGKLFYFLSIAFAFFMCIVFLTIFLLPLTTPYLFFSDRDSYDMTLDSLENRYSPDRNTRFHESSSYSYYLSYVETNDNLTLDISMIDKRSRTEHDIKYIFKSGNFIVEYSNVTSGKEIFNATFTKKNNEFAIHNKYLVRLTESQIYTALSAIESSTITIENYACPYINLAISEYIILDYTVSAVFGVGITFFIFFLTVCIVLITIYLIACKKNTTHLNANYQYLSYPPQKNIESSIDNTITKTESTTLLTAETIATLKKYKELLDKEIISEDEFKSIKSNLLNL